MTQFFERTWFLWSLFALVVIARRSPMLSEDFAQKSRDPSTGEDEGSFEISNLK